MRSGFCTVLINNEIKMGIPSLDFSGWLNFISIEEQPVDDYATPVLGGF